MIQIKKNGIIITIILKIRYISYKLVIAPIIKYKIFNDKGAFYIWKKLIDSGNNFMI